MEDALHNLLSPPILFFALGLLAAFVKSDLELPAPLPKVLSLFLLLSIGFKGGVGLAHSTWTPQIVWCVLIGISMAAAIPVCTFFLLRRRLGVPNAAAIAACYGSVSLVTFIAAATFLEAQKIAYGPYLVAVLALMESPAIVVGVLLLRSFSKTKKPASWKLLMHESMLNGPVVLLTGSLAIGLISTLVVRGNVEASRPLMQSLDQSIFPFVLALFLLDLGTAAGRQIGAVVKAGLGVMAFGMAMPVTAATVTIVAATLAGLSPGDTMLLAVLCGSASYIAVPAAMRIANPEADPSLYVAMSLGITFPFNITIGLPVYWWLIELMN